MSQPTKAARFSAPAPQTLEADELVYGESKPVILDPNRELKAKPTPIASILPDPAQPRRVAPSLARRGWDGRSDADSIRAILETWHQLAEAELGERLPLYVAEPAPESELRPDIDEERTPISYKLMALAAHANDIFINGQNDPIKIFALPNGGYQIEDGERRWMAHWWLLLKTGDLRWSKINAQLRADFSVWRQASSNGSRQGLNAIQKGRQLARLLMAALLETQGLDFPRYEDVLAAGGADKDYYAQVADGLKYRIPRGYGERIAAAMGLTDADEIRRYRALLRVTDDIWIKADDQNWTERTLRPYTVPGGNGKLPKPKPRELTTEEEAFSANVKSALAILRRENKVNVKFVEEIEAFCRKLRAEGKVVVAEKR